MAIHYATQETFDQLIQEGFVVVDFFSSTCVPCKHLSQVLEDIEAELPFVNIVKVNTTENPALARRFSIFAVPTLHFYLNGEKKEERVGLLETEELQQVIGQYLY